MARGDPTVDLAFSVHGPSDGPAVMLLHGFPLARQMWKSQTQTLAEAGYRVITPDLRGLGESPLGSGPATMSVCANDVFKVADGLGVRSFALGGFSMGGYVALEMVAQHPERILGLALVDTKAEADTPEVKRKREETARKVLEEGSVVVAEQMLPKLLTQRTRTMHAEVPTVVLHMMLNCDPKGIAAALRGMALRADRRTLLPKVKVPAVVIVGDSDELTPPEASREMARALPEARLVIVKRAAHLSPLERPDEVTQALMTWLENVARPVVRAG